MVTSFAALVEVGTGVGGVVFLIGWIWLIIMGFKQQTEWWWGLVVLLLPFVGGLIFGILKWPGTKVPLILLIVGFVLGGGSRFVL